MYRLQRPKIFMTWPFIGSFPTPTLKWRQQTRTSVFVLLNFVCSPPPPHQRNHLSKEFTSPGSKQITQVPSHLGWCRVGAWSISFPLGSLANLSSSYSTVGKPQTKTISKSHSLFGPDILFWWGGNRAWQLVLKHGSQSIWAEPWLYLLLSIGTDHRFISLKLY